MVLIPAARALSRAALPVGESRLTIMRTLTPLLIILSAMDANFALSPWAFCRSTATPAVRTSRHAGDGQQAGSGHGKQRPTHSPDLPGEAARGGDSLEADAKIQVVVQGSTGACRCPAETRRAGAT